MRLLTVLDSGLVLVITTTRKEVGVEFTRSRPLATWLATLSASFAGSLVANPLLGKPVRPAKMMRMRIRVAMKTITKTRTVWISQEISSEYRMVSGIW